MLTKAEISFRKKHYNDGFGFVCMKRAYLLEIKGKMEYCAETGVRIHAEGNQNNILDFLKWLETTVTDHSHFATRLSTLKTVRYSEFDLFTQPTY